MVKVSQTLFILMLAICSQSAAADWARDGSDPQSPSTIGSEAALNIHKPKVAILIFDGVQIIDFTGPYEVFGQYRLNDVFTVAPTEDVVTTTMGMKVQPTYAFDDHPKPDVLVVPGGSIGDHRTNEAVQEWILKNAAVSRFVLSVCNGAFFLADGGLLDGKEATTYYNLLDELARDAPKARIVDNRRFADNGKIITSAGLSSGIDAALHVLSKLHGEAWARTVALNMEYDWRPSTDYARAKLADMNIPSSIYSVVMAGGRFLQYDGNQDRWDMTWRIAGDRDQLEVLASVDGKLQEASWERISTTNTRSIWSFVGRDGEPWQSIVVVTASGSDSLDFGLSVQRSLNAQ